MFLSIIILENRIAFFCVTYYLSSRLPNNGIRKGFIEMLSNFLLAVTISFWDSIQHQSLADLEADLLKMEADRETSHHLGMQNV
jgi:hypothetical protein